MKYRGGGEAHHSDEEIEVQNPSSFFSSSSLAKNSPDSEVKEHRTQLVNLHLHRKPSRMISATNGQYRALSAGTFIHILRTNPPGSPLQALQPTPSPARFIPLQDAKGRGHTDSVHQVTFSPNGFMFASAGASGSVKVWRINRAYQSGQNGEDVDVVELVESLDKAGDDVVSCISFNCDGTKLAYACWDGTLKVWDRAQATRTQPPLLDTVMPENASLTVRCLQFSPANPTLFAFGLSDGWLEVRDISKSTVPPLARQRRVHAHGMHGGDKDVLCLTFSPDGSQVATAGRDHVIKVWDLQKDSQKITLHASTVATPADQIVKCLAFNFDGLSLAAGCEDGTIFLWNVGASPPHILVGHRESVNGVAFDPASISFISSSGNSPGGVVKTSAAATTLFSVSGDKTIGCWTVPDLVTATTMLQAPPPASLLGQPEFFPVLSSEGSCIACSPDGSFLAVSSTHVNGNR
jgi:WD40 repeat protein